MSINLRRRKQEGTPECQINLRNRKAATEALLAKERAERDIAEWSEKVAKIAAGDLEVFL